MEGIRDKLYDLIRLPLSKILLYDNIYIQPFSMIDNKIQGRLQQREMTYKSILYLRISADIREIKINL